ncbi:MAG: DUF3298 and DUF4163 domain-containing protein [Bacteroidales bacterium]|nr:DUF3298 and DUF4163 domain-containing protein [Bacteroidales bacterium]
MMNNFRISVFLLIIFMIFSCNSINENENRKGYHVIESNRLVTDSLYYTIKLEYPVFIAEDDQNQGSDIINNTIEKFLDTAARYYWGVEIDSAIVMIDETGTSGKYELYNSYQILDTTPDIISIFMETYSYALGAHGYTALHTHNFDLRQGKFLNLNDVLNFNYSENTSKLNELLAKYFQNPDACFNDLPTAGADFELFGIEPEHLVFYYETYSLGPYYCGTAKVRIPIEELKTAGLWKLDGKI